MLHLDSFVQHMLGNAVGHVKHLSVTLLSAKGMFLFWNKGAAQLDGYEPDEIIGKPLNILHPVVEQKDKLSEYLLSAAGKEGSVRHIGRRMKKDGTIYLANVTIDSIFDDDGQHIGYIRIARELKGNAIE